MGYRPNLDNLTTAKIRAWAAETERVYDGYVHPRIESAEPKGFCMSFGELFMRMTDGQEVPPDERLFCERHTELVAPWLTSHGYKPRDWTRRVGRAYSSFVRDLEFLVRLKESQRFEYIYYDLDDDFKGVDGKLGYLNEEWNLQFFWYNPMKAERSSHWLAKKQKSSYRYLKNMIFVPLTPLEADNVGQFYFFPAHKVDEVIKYAEVQWIQKYKSNT